jgi:hypothetical protein
MPVYSFKVFRTTTEEGSISVLANEEDEAVSTVFDSLDGGDITFNPAYTTVETEVRGVEESE